MESPSKPREALIDGDALLFKAGKALESKSPNGHKITKGPPHFAFHLFKQSVLRILNITGCDEHRIFLADPDKKNFRYDVARTLPYKANRKPEDRPLYEGAIRDYACKNWNTFLVGGIESDDALGIEQDGDRTIICTNDKDLLMIPGWHFDIEHGIQRKYTLKTGEVKYTTLKQWMKHPIFWVEDPGGLELREIKGKKVLVGVGQMWFCAQLLLGDKVDNIPSFEGVGPVTVYNLLRDCKTYEGAVKVCFKTFLDNLPELSYSQVKERFHEQANLVWIKRAPEEEIFDKKWLDEV